MAIRREGRSGRQVCAWFGSAFGALLLVWSGNASAQLWRVDQTGIYLSLFAEDGQSDSVLIDFRASAGSDDPAKAEFATSDAIQSVVVNTFNYSPPAGAFGTLDIQPVGQTCIRVTVTGGADGTPTDWDQIVTLTVTATDQFGKAEPLDLISIQGASLAPQPADCDESPPVAVNDTIPDIQEGSGQTSLDVLANDQRPTPDGDLTISQLITVNVPANAGQLTNGGTSISYTPDPSFSGQFTFQYNVSGSGFRSTNPATVTVNVVGQNNAPVAQDDSTSTTAGQQVTLNVVANDLDADGDTLTVTDITQPANGTARLENDGVTVFYQPDPNFLGTDTFQYTVSDGTATDEGTITVQVGLDNSQPQAQPDTATTPAGQAVVIDVLANDSDPDQDALTITAVTDPPGGTVTITGGQTVTYTPDAGFAGQDSFSYTVSDGGLTDTASVAVTVQPLDEIPLARDDSASTQEDTSVSIAVLSNDVDPEGDPLSIVTVGSPSSGTAVVGPNGSSIVYTPNAGFSGIDTFTYTVTDGVNESAPGTVTVTVQQRFRLESVALNPNQGSMARAVDAICPRLNSIAGSIELTEGQADLLSKCNRIIGNQDDPAEQRNALDALSGEEISTQQTTGIDFSTRQLSNIASRVVALRGGTGGGLSVAGLNIIHDGRSVPVSQLGSFLEELLAGEGGGASGDEGEESDGLLGRRLGIFLNGNLTSGDKDPTARESGFDFDGWGLTVGVDYRFTSNLVLGLALGYNENETSFDGDGGGLDGEALSGSLYGTYFTDNLFVDFIGSSGSIDYDSTRRIVYNDTGGLQDVTASGTTDGSMSSLALSFGYDFHKGGWTFGPTVGMDIIDLDVDPFAETGAGGLNLAFGEQEAESRTLQGGFRFSYAWSREWGIISPHARLSFVKELENDSQIINVHFVNDPFVNDPNSPSPGITIITDEPDEEYMRLGVGFSAVFGNGLSAFVDYDTFAGYTGLSMQELSFGIRFQRSFR